MLRGDEVISPDWLSVKASLTRVFEQQSKITENISFDFQSKGYRAREGEYVLANTDKGYFHLGNNGEQLYRRSARENPSPVGLHSVQQKIQSLESPVQNALVIENSDNTIFITRLNKKTTREKILFRSGFSLIFGVLVSYESDDGQVFVTFLDFIRNANLSSEEDKSDPSGGALVKVAGNAGKYKIDMWFDPSQKFALKRIRQETPPISGLAQLIVAETKITAHEMVSDIYLPSEYYTEEIFSSGQIETYDGEIRNVPSTRDKGEHVLTNFLVDNKKDDFKIVGIPEGTDVFVEDIPQIRHVWADGKIQPATDELMMRIARGGHKFMPGPDEPRFWLMAIGILLIVISLSRMAYKYFTSKK
jgi:hypothetical protein